MRRRTSGSGPESGSELEAAPDGGVVTTDRNGRDTLDTGASDPRGGDESAASELEGENLVVTYPGAEEAVIDGESLSIPAGRITALVGPNGSGKSTLLKTLSSQLSAREGVVRLDGRDVHTLGTKELARKLGLLSQENSSPNSLTVADLVTHGRYPHRGFLDSLTDEDREAIDRALSLAGISHLRDREMDSLSGGQKQLAWIAMTLAQDTQVLLLDEPTTFLDLHHQLEVMDIIQTLRAEREVTIVLVLHDVEQAARYAEHMLALEGGAIYARGTPEAVVTEDLLAAVFGVEAVVEETERGLRITPLRAVHTGDRDDSGSRDVGSDSSSTSDTDTGVDGTAPSGFGVNGGGANRDTNETDQDGADRDASAAADAGTNRRE